MTTILLVAGDASGERVWPMPLVEDYASTTDSAIADVRQTANEPKVGAGSVFAALFLRHFVGQRRWAHLDIAGPARATADKHGIMEVLVRAARQAGVRAIIQVEHDMDLVSRYSHRIVALQEGRVLADLPPDRFFADPALISAVVGRRPPSRHAVVEAAAC